MMNCGYEPTAALGIQARPGDTWKNIKFNFGARPLGSSGVDVKAFNGVSIGRGHLTGGAKRIEPIPITAEI